MIGTVAVGRRDAYEVHIGTGRRLIGRGSRRGVRGALGEAREAGEERHIRVHRGRASSSCGRRRMHVIRCCRCVDLWSSSSSRGRDVVWCTIPIASHQHTLTFIGAARLLLLLLLLRMGHFVVMALVFAVVKRDDDARENQNAENEQRRREQRRRTEPFLFQQILHHTEAHTERHTQRHTETQAQTVRDQPHTERQRRRRRKRERRGSGA